MVLNERRIYNEEKTNFVLIAILFLAGVLCGSVQKVQAATPGVTDLQTNKIYAVKTQADPSSLVSESNTVVAQQKKKVNVNALYRKYLEKHMVNEQGKYFYEMKKFALLDINKDGIRELIIQAYSPGEQYLYSVVNGKVKFIGRVPFGWYVNGDVVFDSSMSRSSIWKDNTVHYNSTDKTLLTRAENTTTTCKLAYRFTGTKLTLKYASTNWHYRQYESWTIQTGNQSKEVSKSQYTAFNKTHMGKYKTYPFRNNTVANRNKYLK